jgi:hypothetical protein
MQGRVLYRKKQRMLPMKVLTAIVAAFVSVGVVTWLSFEPATATAANISIIPVVDGIVRDGLDQPKDGVPDAVLEGSIVQSLNVPQFEDRGIIEFDISSLSQPVTRVDLILNIFGSNGPFPFTIDVFTYTGNGVLSLEDFNMGSFFTSFRYSGESSISLDVTPFIESLVASGQNFAGFNFRFAIPSSISLNGPFVAFNSLEFPPAARLVSIPVVLDTTQPVITVAASPTTLWPPNGKLVPITLSGTITDEPGGSGVNAGSTAYVVMDEYGQIQPKGGITLSTGGSYTFTVALEASRRGNDRDGRHYTIAVSAKDNAGNLGVASTIVMVPHDQGQ